MCAEIKEEDVVEVNIPGFAGIARYAGGCALEGIAVRMPRHIAEQYRDWLVQKISEKEAEKIF